MRISALIAVGLLAAGAGAGWGAALLMQSNPTKQRASEPAHVVTKQQPVSDSSRVDTAQLAAQMRMLVREEVSRLQTKPALPPEKMEEGRAEDTDEAIEAERDAALKVALGIVDSAIVGGKWTADERQEVRDLWGSLDHGRKSQVLSKLLGAFNDGTLRTTEQGPPI